MARVTVEDSLEQVANRFALTVLAARRARALAENRGVAMIPCENKEAVTALREIAAGKVRYQEDVSDTLRTFIEEQRRQLRVTTGEHTFLEAASLRALEGDDEDEEIDLDGDEDVEELSPDPESLNKQAKKTVAVEADEEELDEEEPDAEVVEEETEEAADDEVGEIPDELAEDVDDVDALDDEVAAGEPEDD